MLITTAPDDILIFHFFFFFVFLENIRYDISCESSPDDSHEMPNLIFSKKSSNTNFRMSSATNLQFLRTFHIDKN